MKAWSWLRAWWSLRRLKPGVDVVSIQPGDVVVLTFQGHLTQAERRRIESNLAGVLDLSVKVAVLDGGLSLSAVIRRDA